MIKKPLLIRHVISFKAVVLFFLLVHSRTFSQTSVTRIYTDWNGYWTSNSATGTNNQPNTENNLLAFDWGGKTYATGVNNATLTSRSIAFENSLFRALKIQSLEYTSSTYFLQGSMIDGSLTNRVLTPPLLGTTSVPAELAYRLTDGINGLALGTGIANIKPASASFKVGTNNVLVGAIGDNIPDIVVTQVASPNSTVDKFRFVDSNNVTVGVSVNVNFTSMAVMGTYRLDLFNANNGAPSSTYAANETRDIRILAIDLSSFGITSANAGQIDSFVVDFSGDSDCAFIAFNKNSLKTAEVALVKKASMTGCGKEGSVINYTFEVTNTGQVPLTDIQVTDPKISTISGAPVASLAVGATAVFTGNYTVTAADVALGRVINTAKITALDPSLNIVEDISGNTNNDDIPTSINLLDPPVLGSVKNITCNSLGTIALSNLPSGSWTLERNSASGTVNTTGSGTTFTVTGLAAGTYSFRVTNSTGCKSPSTAGTTISSQTTNTWNGTSWSTGSVPTLDQNIVFTGNYPPAADPNVDLYGCTCLVSGSTAKVTIKTGRTLTITNWVNVATDQNLIIENNASLVQINNASVNSGSIIYKRSSQP
ncbi:DUF7507 domain-containing protein, partial [Flavobacterium fluviatile]|uniref:DUF7507 domain-containing protein n=1 Tax=Flavobacterium fluviatile TaxID=1862387 RepID=UPI003CC6E905